MLRSRIKSLEKTAVKVLGTREQEQGRQEACMTLRKAYGLEGPADPPPVDPYQSLADMWAELGGDHAT